MGHRGCLLALAIAGTLAAPAAALAAGGSDPDFPDSTVALTITGPRQADQALSIHATGGNQDRVNGLHTVAYGLELIVTDPKLLPGACETSEQAELSRIATVRGGGSLLTYVDLDEGAAGRFALTEPYEPVGSGPLQVCAYSEWDHQDAAWAQANVQIAPAPVRPRASARPRIHRSGRDLVCERGRWTGSPRRYAFRWQVGRGRLSPARVGAARYAITARDRGQVARCEVLARGAGGTGSATSPGFRIR